ncbi:MULTISPECIES: efflux RND transporter permease subunit [Hymenobacter]|uniref:Multidrug efflux pump subunit AcrB n=1 Tax=Hymenobacter psychrotolerans DSM 18569 TaxID=1121959 RepID=A0A1M6ZTU4_9BACT|nr:MULTISPECIES: efflux RND transporter permease subunit [Hymenobacter]QNE42132.1 efflux RND transporter permease subunit [Hymenobacter sp. NBH84]SHL33836.1 Multidrug efflux pump subunit AcrB [Hymenobacter psychrotolerans DSM 18569]
MYELIRSALQRPLTVVVAMLAILFFAFAAVRDIAVDIFPSMDVPAIYVAEPYGGLSPEQLDGFMANQFQNNFLFVSGVKKIETKSIQGLTLIKLSFYPGTDMAQAAAEVATQVSRATAFMPLGTLPPQVVRFDASSLPVGQLVLESEKSSLTQLQDLAASRIRPMFTTIPGVTSTAPFGGNIRTIVVKADPAKLRGYQLTPDDVVKAIVSSNQPSAAGNVKMGDVAYMAPVNSLIEHPADFLDVPLRTGAGPGVYLRDVASVEDAADVTTGYAVINGKRAIYMPVIKKADASTLKVVQQVKDKLPTLRALLPEDVKLSYAFDQSTYVANSLKSLVTEGVLGAVLTGLMVLLFLRDWRSVVIVITTIPLSVLSAVILLKLFGQTLNIMTLSGLALAIGVLVDEATVTIENIHQHLERGKPKAQAIWDAAREIALPKLLILLCILAVFAPALIMEGVPRAMFLPLSLAVGFAMVASFLLSQTLVPVMANWLMKDHAPAAGHDHDEAPEKPGFFARFQAGYQRLLTRTQGRQSGVVLGYLALSLVVVGAGFAVIGTDIFPQANSGQFQLRLREKVGTRLEKSEQTVAAVQAIINKEVGPDNVEISSTFVGTQPASFAVNSVFVFTTGPHEALMQVALKEGVHVNLSQLKERLRRRIHEAKPGLQLSFEPIELVEKVMSDGAPTPIQVNVGGKNLKEAAGHARKVLAQLRQIPYLRDVQIAQPLQYPALRIDVDRERAAQFGLTSQEITQSVVAATSSSRFTSKNLWLDPKSGLGYQVQVQLPEDQLTQLQDLEALPVKAGQARPTIGEVATVSARMMPGQIDRQGPYRLVSITANVQGRDLGTAAQAVRKALKQVGEPPRGVVANLVGQPQLLEDTMSSLQTGLGMAIVVIFLLLAANFQSFRLSLVVLSVVPAVVAGSLLMLLATGATLNLQSYMGMIMSVGVSVANAILLITSADHLRHEHRDVPLAARLAADTRIRPILMTSIAMIAGMLPMASGLGEGGDQIAPLGQAVIGGLIASTLASLLVLPHVFGWAMRRVGYESGSLLPTRTRQAA